MKEIKYLLISDGGSDKALMQIIKWSLDDLFKMYPNEGSFADFRNIPNPPKSLGDKVNTAHKLYNFNLLFIHRDAEKTNLKMIDKRIAEIKRKIPEDEFERTVCIIPVKMMETWLLFDIEGCDRTKSTESQAIQH